jgi:hypothetical protein
MAGSMPVKINMENSVYSLPMQTVKIKTVMSWISPCSLLSPINLNIGTLISVHKIIRLLFSEWAHSNHYISLILVLLFRKLMEGGRKEGRKEERKKEGKKERQKKERQCTFFARNEGQFLKWYRYYFRQALTICLEVFSECKVCLGAGNTI